LKNFDIDANKGFYSWRVRSFDGVSWSGFSSYSPFLVFSTGFNSSFNTHAKKWISVNGDWSRTDAGYLKSTGFNNSFASALQKEFFIDDFVYTVRMKAKGGVDQTQGVIIGGYPTPTFGQNYWNDGVYFLYKNDKASFLIIRDGAVYYWSSWVTQPALNPTGWNELEVIVNVPNATFRVNGVAVFYLINFPADIEPGYVGLAHFRSTAMKNPLLVDWAKLSYLPNPTADGIEPDLNGAMVIDFNDLSQYPSQSGSPFDPTQ